MESSPSPVWKTCSFIFCFHLTPITVSEPPSFFSSPDWTFPVSTLLKLSLLINFCGLSASSCSSCSSVSTESFVRPFVLFLWEINWGFNMECYGSISTWHIEISFLVRIVTYFLILGLFIIFVSVLFKCLGVFRNEWGTEEAAELDIESETNPLMPEKVAPCSYGTMEDHSNSSLCCDSSMNLYDGKICVICYDGHRNCFFTPCGHCATCYTCAQK